MTGVDLANRHARQFLANGASPSGAIEHPGTMTAEQRTGLRDQFATRHTGASNASSTLILDGGLTWKASQILPEDAELLETRKFGVIEICRLLPQCTAHGLRKAAARRFAEAGCSDQQTKAWTGHTTDSEVSRYTAAADQQALSDSAGEMLMADLRKRLANERDNTLEKEA